jgi:hypothetical protein
MDGRPRSFGTGTESGLQTGSSAPSGFLRLDLSALLPESSETSVVSDDSGSEAGVVAADADGLDPVGVDVAVLARSGREAEAGLHSSAIRAETSSG